MPQKAIRPPGFFAKFARAPPDLIRPFLDLQLSNSSPIYISAERTLASFCFQPESATPEVGSAAVADNGSGQAHPQCVPEGGCCVRPSYWCRRGIEPRSSLQKEACGGLLLEGSLYH